MTDRVTELMMRLKHHDWYFEYSDDLRVYNRGAAAEQSLVRDLAALSRHEREFYLSSEAVPQGMREKFRAAVMKAVVEHEDTKGEV